MKLAVLLFVGFAVFCTTLAVDSAPVEKALPGKRMHPGMMELEKMEVERMDTGFKEGKRIKVEKIEKKGVINSIIIHCL